MKFCYLVCKIFRNVSPDLVRSGRTRPANLGVLSCPVRKLICPVQLSPKSWRLDQFIYASYFRTQFQNSGHSVQRGEKKGGGDGKDLESYPSLEWFTLPKALQIQGSLPLSVWNKNMPPNEMASLSLTDVVWWDLHICGTKFSHVPD